MLPPAQAAITHAPHWRGPAVRGDGRAPLAWGALPQQRFLADPDWDSPAFLTRYAEQFTSNYIAELLCRVAFLEPNLDDLGDDVSMVTRQLSDAFGSLSRLVAIPKLVRVKAPYKPSFQEVINFDDEIRKQQRVINQGMLDNQQDLNDYLENHDKEYSHIYVNDKDAYVRRYEFNNPSVFQFQSDRQLLMS